MRAMWVVAILAALSVGCSAAPQSIERAIATAAAVVAPTPQPVFWLTAPIEGDPSPLFAHIPSTGAIVEGQKVRLPPPSRVPEPRRVAIQAGHIKVEDAPAEFPHLREQSGAIYGDVAEVDVTADVAGRVAALLRARGLTVDVLPATVPPAYLADAFVSLHADSDDVGDASGYKIAHGFYRGPFEDALVRALTEEYGRATKLRWDNNVTGEMTDYYAFAWYRYEHALPPHVPAAIVELGFISNDDDRELLVDHADVVAQGIAQGVLRFLAETPRSSLFAKEIVVPTVPAPSATPSASAR